MNRITLVIPGEPKGKGRPRAVPSQRPDGSLFVRMVTPQDTRREEARIRDAFRRKYPNHKPFTGPVMLRFTAVFETPKSFSKALREAADRGKLYALKKPDKDNIEKLAIDSLNGIAFVDDQQVMGGGIKRYGSPARLEISLEPLDTGDAPMTPGQRRAEKAQQGKLPLRELRHTPRETAPAARPAPDLSQWSPRQRERIEAALARDAAARRR